MKHFFKNIKYGIKNLITWFPIIWKDRSWDSYYIHLILHKKLSIMSYDIEHHGHHKYRMRDVNNINKCIYILNRIIKDDYHALVFKNHEKKWGKPKFHWIDCNDKDGYTELKITHGNVKTKEDKKQEQKEFRRIIKEEGQLEKQDIEYLFDTMKKHIRSWWD